MLGVFPLFKEFITQIQLETRKIIKCLGYADNVMVSLMGSYCPEGCS